MDGKIQLEDFELVYEETYSKVLKFVVIKCYKLEDVNDILQDTYVEFLKILKRKRSLKIDDIVGYICGISKNIIKRHYYSKFKLSVISDEASLDIPDNFEIEDDFIHKENVQKVWEYIEKRDINIAKIFYLYFVLDMKISNIAEELKLTESTVKSKLYRMLKELKRNFGKEGFESEK